MPIPPLTIPILALNKWSPIMIIVFIDTNPTRGQERSGRCIVSLPSLEAFEAFLYSPWTRGSLSQYP